MMRPIPSSIIVLLVALQTAAFAKSTFSSDLLDGVHTVEVGLVLGGALGHPGDKSLFASYPQLGEALKPCIDHLIQATLAERSVSAVDQFSFEAEADRPVHELRLSVYGRPITISNGGAEVATYYIQLEFFSDLEHLRRTGDSSSDEVPSICEYERSYMSSHLDTVTIPDLREELLRDISTLLNQFAMNPAYCAGEGKPEPGCKDELIPPVLSLCPRESSSLPPVQFPEEVATGN